MDSFFSEDEIKEIGFKSVGQNVKISRKASIYSPGKMTIGNFVRVDDFCILSGNIVLGDYVHIAAYVGMFAGDAGIEMQDFSGVSSKSTVYAVNDDYSGVAMSNPTIPDEYRMVTSKRVVIKKHVSIGAGCVILPGVTLEEGSAFGVMSLIHKNPKPWSINIGVPFRQIGIRDKNILVLEEKFLKGKNIK